MPDLVALAQQYVETSEQLETIRNAMRAALANGHDVGKEALKPRPTPARPSRAERMATARAAETRMIELLKERPMGPTEIAKATGANRATVADRLTRLRDKGLAEPCGDGGWRVVSS
jgi:DNA invertase Pin-like site-specific DNA recombinase